MGFDGKHKSNNYKQNTNLSFFFCCSQVIPSDLCLIILVYNIWAKPSKIRHIVTIKISKTKNYQGEFPPKESHTKILVSKGHMKLSKLKSKLITYFSL